MILLIDTFILLYKNFDCENNQQSLLIIQFYYSSSVLTIPSFEKLDNELILIVYTILRQ